MSKITTTALAGALLGLVVGGASADVPFAVYSLNGTYVIEAHGFQTDNLNPTDTGENAILGLVTFDGAGAVSGVGFSFTHNDSFGPPAETINCSVQITGGNYTVNAVTGAGTVTMNFIRDAGFPGGSPACTTLGNTLNDNLTASFTFAFVLNDTLNTLVATSAPVQLIRFSPVPLAIGGDQPLLPSGFQLINGMNLQGTLRLR
jgi:hypothetical protein